MTDPKISKEDFKTAITAAVKSRNPAYNHSFALSIRWEADNINAVEDTNHFQTILSTFNFPKAEELVLLRNDKTPGWSVHKKIHCIFEDAKRAVGGVVIMIHYAGHGFVKKGKLFASEDGTGGKPMNLSKFMVEPSLEDDYYLADTRNVDVVYILACCYAHCATRDSVDVNRVVEILAATDDETPTAMSPPRNTLTGKLRGEIARRKRDGHQYVEMAELIQNLRSKDQAVIKPSHYVEMGASSVCLPFSGLIQVNPSTISPSLQAVFSVHIAENMTQDQLNGFVNWINQLPTSFSITLEGVYDTNSTLLILQAPYSVYSKISILKAIKLIAETTKPSLHPGATSGRISGTFAAKENILVRPSPSK